MTCSTEERYTSATVTSNLRVEADVIGSADVLIAAGMCKSRFGALLMRIVSKASSSGIAQAHEQLSFIASKFGVSDPNLVSIKALSWWMDHTCAACNGTKFERIEGTPALSDRVCKSCGGTGEQTIPSGEAGKRLINYLDDCKSAAVVSIKKRLRQY